MTNKRIILEIPTSTHERIKNFAIKDKRTMTTVLRIMIDEMIDKLIDDKEKQHNLIGSKPSVDFKIHQNIEENREINQHGRVLTDEERAYLFENPFSDLSDFEKSKVNNNEDRLF